MLVGTPCWSISIDRVAVGVLEMAASSFASSSISGAHFACREGVPPSAGFARIASSSRAILAVPTRWQAELNRHDRGHVQGLAASGSGRELPLPDSRQRCLIQPEPPERRHLEIFDRAIGGSNRDLHDNMLPSNLPSRASAGYSGSTRLSDRGFLQFVDVRSVTERCRRSAKAFAI